MKSIRTPLASLCLVAGLGFSNVLAGEVNLSGKNIAEVESIVRDALGISDEPPPARRRHVQQYTHGPAYPQVVPYHPGMQIVGRHPQHAGLCVCVDRYGRRVLAPCPPQRGYAGYNQPRPYQQQYQPLPRVPQVYGFRDARIVSGVQTMPYNQNPYGNYRAPFVYNRGGDFIPPR